MQDEAPLPPPPPPAARTGKMPYPVNIISEDDLLNAGAPDWECITPGSYRKYKDIYPLSLQECSIKWNLTHTG